MKKQRKKISDTIKSKNSKGKVIWICNRKLNISKKIPIIDASFIVNTNKDWSFGRIKRVINEL